MKKWSILRRRLKEYENLAVYDKETEKYENLASEVLEGFTRFSNFFCYLYEGFFIFPEISYFFCLGDKILPSHVQL